MTNIFQLMNNINFGFLIMLIDINYWYKFIIIAE